MMSKPKPHEIRFSIKSKKCLSGTSYDIETSETGEELLDHCRDDVFRWGGLGEVSQEIRDMQLRELKKRISRAAKIHGYKAVFTRGKKGK